MATTSTAVQSPEGESADAVRASLLRCFERGEWELPVLPDVAARVLSLTEDPDSDAKELAVLIQRDPSLAGHILRIANSPLYSPRSQIVSLQQAVAWMGLFEISEIAFSVAIRAKIFNVPGQESCVEMLWKHAYATASWCKELARATRTSVDTAYLCGLLHQIGIPIVLQSVADILAKEGLTLDAEEFRALAGDYHVAVAGQAVAEWGLPAAVPSVITHWQDFGSGGAHRRDAALVNVAHRMADTTLAGANLQLADYSGDPAVAELNLYEEELGKLMERQEAVRTALQCV